MDVGCRIERIARVWVDLAREKEGAKCVATLNYSSGCSFVGSGIWRACIIDEQHTYQYGCVRVCVAGVRGRRDMEQSTTHGYCWKTTKEGRKRAMLTERARWICVFCNG